MIKTTRFLPRPTEGVRAFTLLELLTMLAIITILIGLTVPAFNWIQNASKLTQSLSLILAEMDETRLRAIATNHTQEIRFYRVDEEEIPLETSPIVAIQSFHIDASGASRPNSRVKMLAEGIIISPLSLHSAVFDTNVNPLVKPTGNEPISKFGSFFYQVIRYLPNGSADIYPEKADMFFTLLTKSDLAKVTASTLPANFVTVLIQPTNASAKVYRP